MLVLWIGTAVASVAGILALILIAVARRPGEADDLGSLSHRWIAAHRANSS